VRATQEIDLLVPGEAADREKELDALLADAGRAR
jgi:hypothetical protein